MNDTEQSLIDDYYHKSVAYIEEDETWLDHSIWYHYTSFENAIKIIESRELKFVRQPNIKYQQKQNNDTQEIYFATYCLWRHVANCGNESMTEYVHRIYQILMFEAQNPKFYISCGSLTKDDSELYRRYGDNKGVALGFRIKKMFPKPATKLPDIVKQVKYGFNAYEDEIRQVIIRYLAVYDNLINESKNQDHFDSLNRALIAVLFRYLPLIKTKERWEIEKECRLFMFSFANIGEVDDFMMVPLDLKNSLVEISFAPEFCKENLEIMRSCRERSGINFNTCGMTHLKIKNLTK